MADFHRRDRTRYRSCTPAVIGKCELRTKFHMLQRGPGRAPAVSRNSFGQAAGPDVCEKKSRPRAILVQHHQDSMGRRVPGRRARRKTQGSDARSEDIARGSSVNPKEGRRGRRPARSATRPRPLNLHNENPSLSLSGKSRENLKKPRKGEARQQKTQFAASGFRGGCAF